MPLYEFACIDCGKKFEELVFSVGADVPCPACGSEKTDKQFSTFASNALRGGDKCGGCKPKSGMS